MTTSQPAPVTPAQLAEIQAAVDTATLPWEAIDRIDACGIPAIGLSNGDRFIAEMSYVRPDHEITRARVAIDIKQCATLANAAPSLLAEVHRLRAEVEASDQRMAAILDGTFSVGDGTAQREIERLRAELGHVDPAEEPTLTEALGEGRCECCGRVIAAGERVATWEDGERTVAAHAGPCPFSSRTIEIATPFGARQRVDAVTFGLWAMHPRVMRYGCVQPYWTVTHIPSGKFIVDALTRREARRVLEALGLRCSGPEFEKIVSGVSPLVDIVQRAIAEAATP